ncbi:MAG: hypothetical protein G01um101413_704 [Parcubacteria group bacterium Gr01-1014_13]|nr:MAG: hypothetical protein G01um101413_704 [Parcubacteria group bacterium Gr01-1014_13]
MENTGRKTAALLIVISALYLAVFDWEWPSITHLKFSWPYTIGIAVAVLFCMAERFLKHANTPDFQWKKLFKTHFFAFLIFCPISIIVILPKLGPANDIWSTDYRIAFLITFFFITVGPKIGTISERLESLLTPKNGKKTGV